MLYPFFTHLRKTLFDRPRGTIRAVGMPLGAKITSSPASARGNQARQLRPGFCNVDGSRYRIGLLQWIPSLFIDIGHPVPGHGLVSNVLGFRASGSRDLDRERQA